MKKILAIVLALTVVLVCFAACGGKTNTDANTNTDAEETTAAAVTYADAVEVITSFTKVFTTLEGDNKFDLVGGDEEHINYENPAPGKYDVSKADELAVAFCFPVSQSANIADAATAMNTQMANHFSSAAYLLKEGTDVAAFAADYKTAVENNHWMCGMPEKYVVLQTGNYVVTAFGLSVNIEHLKTQAASEGATVVLEGDIAV